ncbi:hypothetical protein PVK06_022690 [Gossypium arboreum]|uniref:Uncharacterized protein n=1 Tax=Gossypium arboreum TaxID=29729 RepID=A0ABR0P913_GOSAR|nr:hypothetical protein PVK06_022690 [Gossypium arboreum]
MVPRLDIARDNPWDFLKSSFDWHTVRYCEAFKEFLTSVWHTARDVVRNVDEFCAKVHGCTRRSFEIVGFLKILNQHAGFDNEISRPYLFVLYMELLGRSISSKVLQDNGGLGFKHIDSQNDALLMKFAFALITKMDHLWVQILRSKYKMDGLVPNKLKDKNVSRHWKGIGNVREDKRPSKEWLKVNSGGAREIDTRIAIDEWIRCYGRKIGNAWCLMRNSGEPWMASTMLGPLAQRR